MLSVCGDGVKSGLEGCDGADRGTVDCVSATGDASSAGTVSCFANCTLDLTLCSTPPSSTGGACGDGLKDNLEQCDGADVGGASCATVLGTGSTATLGCHASCTLDASGCSVSGGGAGGAGGGGAAGGAGAAGKPACAVTSCLNHVYACGDCVDNDGDGLTDMEDPDCLGPCHNNEDSFALGIPGANNAPCKQDCYYDYDSGSGNDGCEWDHSCDPLEVAPDFYPEGNKCQYDPKTKVTPQLSCTQAAAAQPAACTSYCAPLTPNGCDCFGCRELPAAGGKFVWLGSTDSSGAGSCKLGDEDDPTKCHPCTPVPACLNTCEECELCLGKTTLPPQCTPPSQACGKGVVEGSEQCDGSSVPATCATITGNPTSSGTVTCAPNCTFDGSSCSAPTFAGLAAAIAIAVAWLAGRRGDGVTVVAEAGATVTRARVGADDVVTLDGVESFDVAPLSPGRRLRVRAAADVLEVKGTVFRVAATPGGFASVTVQAGVVEVAPACCARVTLRAGEAWTRPAAARRSVGDGARRRWCALASDASAPGSIRDEAARGCGR